MLYSACKRFTQNIKSSIVNLCTFPSKFKPNVSTVILARSFMNGVWINVVLVDGLLIETFMEYALELGITYDSSCGMLALRLGILKIFSYILFSTPTIRFILSSKSLSVGFLAVPSVENRFTALSTPAPVTLSTTSTGPEGWTNVADKSLNWAFSSDSFILI